MRLSAASMRGPGGSSPPSWAHLPLAATPVVSPATRCAPVLATAASARAVRAQSGSIGTPSTSAPTTASSSSSTSSATARSRAAVRPDAEATAWLATRALWAA